MNIKLKAEWEMFVRELVADGAYVSPGDVPTDALQLLKALNPVTRPHPNEVTMYDGPTIQAVFEAASKKEP